MSVVDFEKGEKIKNCLFTSKGMTLLHWSCDRGYTKMVNMLIKCRTNINEQVQYITSFGTYFIYMVVAKEVLLFDSLNIKPEKPFFIENFITFLF